MELLTPPPHTSSRESRTSSCKDLQVRWEGDVLVLLQERSWADSRRGLHESKARDGTKGTRVSLRGRLTKEVLVEVHLGVDYS